MSTTSEYQGIADAMQSDEPTTDAPTEIIQHDYTAFEEFLERVGDIHGHADDWDAVASISIGAIHAAESDGEISNVTAALDKKGHRRAAIGYSGQDILAWAQRHNIPYELTAVARAMADGSISPGESIDCDELYNVGGSPRTRDVGLMLGIPRETVETALSSGKMRFKDGGWCNSSRICGAALVSWLDSDQIQLRPSITIVRRVVMRRDQAAGDTVADDSEPAGESLIGSAFDAIESARQNDEADIREDRCRVLSNYRQVLARRAAPDEGDAKLLVEIASYLGFNRERVDRDACTLDRAVEMQSLADQRDAADAELHAAGRSFKDLEKRHKLEAAAARRRRNAAYDALGVANSSPIELDELQRNNPDLFANG